MEASLDQAGGGGVAGWGGMKSGMGHKFSNASFSELLGWIFFGSVAFYNRFFASYISDSEKTRY